MGSVFLRNSSWVIEYKFNGKTKRETIGKNSIITKTFAKEVLKKRELEIKLGQFQILDKDVPTLKEFSNRYLDYIKNVKQNRSWKSTEFYLKTLNSVFGDKKTK